jgi:hypothetical protein
MGKDLKGDYFGLFADITPLTVCKRGRKGGDRKRERNTSNTIANNTAYRRAGTFPLEHTWYEYALP